MPIERAHDHPPPNRAKPGQGLTEEWPQTRSVYVVCFLARRPAGTSQRSEPGSPKLEISM